MTARSDDPSPDGVPADRPGAANKRPRLDRSVVACYLGLALVVALGTAIRLHGLTTHGLWRDDAWTALTSRVGLGTALHMSTTTPGFTLLARWWIGIHPGSSLWAQALPLVFGVGGVLAMYAVSRFYGLPRWLSILGALVVATSPVAVQYSTHVKQYSADLLLASLLLWMGEAARRSGSRRRLVVLALASAGAALASASVLPVVGGVWVALLIDAVAHRERIPNVLRAGVPLGVYFVGLYLLLLRHLPPVLHRYWLLSGAFIDRSSPRAIWHSVAFAISVLTVGLVAPAGHLGTLGDVSWHPGAVFLPACLLFVLLLVGLTAGWRAATAGLTLGVAFVATLAGRIPLGTGRTDEVLYPAIVLLAALGVQRAGELVGRRVDTTENRHRAGTAIVTALSLVLGGVIVESHQVRHPSAYPEIDVRSLAAKLASQRLPGDRTLVDPYTRYNWALHEARHVRVKFGNGWGAGFSVISDQPDAFVSPTETWEAGYQPDRWASQVADAGRVWYLGTWFLSRSVDPVYRALTAQGWAPQQEFAARGGFLVLLTGGGTSAQDLLQSAIRAQDRGELGTAFESYHAVIDKDSTNFYAYYDLGLIDATQGRIDTAVTEYRTAIFYNSTYTPAMFNLAGLLRRDHPADAVALYRQVLSFKPGDAKTEFNLGVLLVQTGSMAEGRADVTRAIQSDPSLNAQLPPGLLGP